MRLIDIDNLVAEWKEMLSQMGRYNDGSYPVDFRVVIKTLDLVPIVGDVAPVVHGRWIDHFVRDWRCSECGEPIYKVRNVDGYCYDDKPNFCPNCGADMRERKGDDAELN